MPPGQHVTPTSATVASATVAADPARGTILFIGNATLLVRYAGFTILTDPNFVHMHEQVSIGYGMHATRLTDPALAISDLPPIDLVVLSHFHGDHFDQVAERELDRGLPIATPPEAAEQLGARGFTNLKPLKTWEAFSMSKGDARVRVTAAPGRHGPILVDFALPDVMGSILEFDGNGVSPVRLYITGDTLIFEDLQQIPSRYPDLDVALLHLGGTRVMGIMVTMDAKQGIELLDIIQPKTAIPIHYDDYDLFKSPLSDFQAEVQAAGLSDRVRYLSRGETFTFSADPAS